MLYNLDVIFNSFGGNTMNDMIRIDDEWKRYYDMFGENLPQLDAELSDITNLPQLDAEIYAIAWGHARIAY